MRINCSTERFSTGTPISSARSRSIGRTGCSAALRYASENPRLAGEAAAGDTLRHVLTQESADDEKPTSPPPRDAARTSEPGGPSTWRPSVSQAIRRLPTAEHRAGPWWPILEYREDMALTAFARKVARTDELYAAVHAARQAVRLYRDEFAYHSMVIMQFDAALALRRLGERTVALAVLRGALRMDRQYGFRRDARENERLMLRSRGEPAGRAQLADFMRKFPQRRTTLRFAWRPSTGRIMFDERHVRIEASQIGRARAKALLTQRISADRGGGWSVSYTHRLTGYQPGVWPSKPTPLTAQLSFAAVQIPGMDFKVDARGKFEGVTGLKALATRLTAAADNLIRAGEPTVDRGSAAMRIALASTALALSPGLLQAQTAERYEVRTTMWIGATLKQGVWYHLSAALSLPGMPRLILPQRIRFAFTRRGRVCRRRRDTQLRRNRAARDAREKGSEVCARRHARPSLEHPLSALRRLEHNSNHPQSRNAAPLRIHGAGVLVRRDRPGQMDSALEVERIRSTNRYGARPMPPTGTANDGERGDARHGKRSRRATGA